MRWFRDGNGRDARSPRDQAALPVQLERVCFGGHCGVCGRGRRFGGLFVWSKCGGQIGAASESGAAGPSGRVAVEDARDYFAPDLFDAMNRTHDGKT